MQRIPLSGNLLADKITYSIATAIVLFITVRISPLAFLIGLALGSWLIYSVFYFPKHIEFDAGNMYVKRNGDEETIPLENIYKVKMTMGGVKHRALWKVEYTDNNNETAAARFYPRFRPSTLNDFINAVKAKNPAVQVRYWSWSFDFDQ